MVEDIFSDPVDKQRIRNQQIQIEFLRDFLVWLCEEECDSTVTEMEEKYKDWEAEQLIS